MNQETEDHLYRQLIKLGDMMGDGLHLHSDGKWIAAEYRRVLRALGIVPKRKNNSKAINERMAQRVEDVSCGGCGGRLTQTRSGSKRARCSNCGALWKLLK